MRKILFLGNQSPIRPLVEIAKNEGYYIVVIGLDPDSVVAKSATVFYLGNYRDLELCLSIARKEGVNGVLGTDDLSALSAAYIASNMGLPGNDFYGVGTIVHKSRFRNLQQEIGLFAPFYFASGEEDEFVETVKNHSFPLVIKPDQSCSSRGVQILYGFDETEVRKSFRAAKDYSSDGLACAEEYISAPGNDSFLEFSVFVIDGKVEYFFPFNDVRTKYNSRVPAQCSLPVVLTDDQIRTAKQSIELIFKATKTRFGEYDVEAFFTAQNQFFIIEINPRRGGGDIQLYIKEHSGVDLSRLIVQLAVNDQRYYEDLKNKAMGNKYITKQCLFSGKSGHFKSLWIHPEIKDFVVTVKMLVDEGDLVYACRDYRDKIGEIVFHFENREQQLKYYDKLEDYIVINLQEVQENV